MKPFDQKVPHSQKSGRVTEITHEPVWYEKKIARISDLQHIVLNRATIKNDEEEESSYLTKKAFKHKKGFKELLEEYRQLNIDESNEGKTSVITRQDLNSVIKKLENMVIVTKGLTDPAKLQAWLCYTKIKSGKAIVNNLNYVKKFCEELSDAQTRFSHWRH